MVRKAPPPLTRVQVPTADDDRTTSIGYRRRRLLAGTDGSKDDDDDINIDNTDNTRPATTMVTNVASSTCNKRIPHILQASQVPAIAASLHVGPASTLRQSTTTTPSRRKTHTDATPSRCKTHHDTNLPRRHPQHGAQDPPRRNPLPASPAVVPSKYSMQEPTNPPQRRPDTASGKYPFFLTALKCAYLCLTTPVSTAKPKVTKHDHA
ncbi:hypothetical protein EDB85DRAFT_2201918 [Lactarius pseudohatsudake]|nr:hypothetical protein EDB85DRAFT_2201918 [Lactarius pseudohatsudake]